MKSIWAKVERMIPQNQKPPLPFGAFVILADFLATFYQNWAFRQHRGQQVLTKILSSEQAHKTERKTYLQFFYI